MVGGGCFTIVIAIVVAFIFGPEQALRFLSQGGGSAPPQAQVENAPAGRDDGGRQFVEVVLAETEDTWNSLFQQAGQSYREPKLVLFTDRVRSACGMASAATGPFYCPADMQVYMDLGFFDQLRRMGGGGDFAAAYVIAHEVGHHVQRLLGTEREVRAMQQRLGQAQSNDLSVKMELQADCFAGVWGHYAQQEGLLEQGDLQEALSAAGAIGDDALQQQAGRVVRPETFTHGSSSQRIRWFRTGFESGDPNQCNTFG